MQAARLDLYINGEILSPNDDKRLISQVPLRDRTVSVGLLSILDCIGKVLKMYCQIYSFYLCLYYFLFPILLTISHSPKLLLELL